MNTAARHESTGQPGRIQCSASTYELLKEKFNFEERGLVDMKGKGQQRTYWLTGAQANVPGTVSDHEIVQINQKLTVQLSQVRTRQVYFKAENKIINGDAMSETSYGTETSLADEGSFNGEVIKEGYKVLPASSPRRDRNSLNRVSLSSK